jgi:hypothetical protein
MSSCQNVAGEVLLIMSSTNTADQPFQQFHAAQPGTDPSQLGYRRESQQEQVGLPAACAEWVMD